MQNRVSKRTWIIVIILIISILFVATVLIQRAKNKNNVSTEKNSSSTFVESSSSDNLSQLNNSQDSSANGSKESSNNQSSQVDQNTQNLINQVNTGGSLNLQGQPQKINVNGVTRDFILYLPPNFKQNKLTDLIFVFHGGGSDMTQMEKATNWNQLAANNNFAAVYPNSLNKNWNDGRLDQATLDKDLGDDVSFVRDLVDTLVKYSKINPKKVFATGVSNGGFMSQKVACDLTSRFTAIAPIASTVPQNYLNSCKPSRAIPVIWFEGTKDPLVPFTGGELKTWDGLKLVSRGTVLSFEDTIKFWNTKNGCTSTETRSNMPNINTKDSSTAVLRAYCENTSTPQLYYQIDGGGHTWPGGPQYLPKLIVGNVNQDIVAQELIWQFFKDK